jgi:hypothetical protein
VFGFNPVPIAVNFSNRPMALELRPQIAYQGRMKKLIRSSKLFFTSFLIFSLFSSLSLARPFTEILGNSLAEKQIQWLWKNRSMILKSCEFDAAKCSRDPKVTSAILGMEQLVELSIESEIKFVSEKEKPGFFTSDQGETHRVAMTTNEPKEPIYFNTDQISKLDLNQLCAILFHELTHKLNIADDSQRIPDLVGAAIAANLKNNLAVSPFPLKDGKQIQIAAFLSSTKETITGTDFNLGAIRGFGFLTDNHLFIDLDMSKFEIDLACKADEEKLAAQSLRVPLWVQSKDRPNRIKGLVLMNNMCVVVKKNTYSVVTRAMSAELQFSDSGEIIRDSLVIGLSSSPEALVEYLSTVELISSQVPASAKVGDSIQILLKVRNRGALKADQCESGYQLVTSELPSDNNGTMLMFDQCKIESLGEDQYEIKINTRLLPALTTGTYRMPLLKISGTGGYGMAYLQLESQVSWKVDGISNQKTLALAAPKFVNLKPLANLGDYPLKNSFTYSRDQVCQIEMALDSKETFAVRSLDITFLIGMDGKLATAHAFADPKDFGFAMKSYRFEKRGEGQVLILEFLMPSKYQGGSDLWGLRLDGIVIQNEKSAQSAAYHNSDPYTNMMFLDLIRGTRL